MYRPPDAAENSSLPRPICIIILLRSESSLDPSAHGLPSETFIILFNFHRRNVPHVIMLVLDQSILLVDFCDLDGAQSHPLQHIEVFDETGYDIVLSHGYMHHA